MLRVKFLVVAGLCLMPLSAYALTPDSEIETPEGVPDQTPLWQYFTTERGDVHWTYAQTYAHQSGIAEKGATAIDVMRLIKNMPQNSEVRWVVDTVRAPDGTMKRYPAFMAGQRVYLPVVPDTSVSAGPPVADGQLASYEAAVAELRGEFVAEQARLSKLIAELAEQVSAGETGLEGQLTTIWEEFQAVRESIPEQVNLDPLREAIGAIAQAVEDIKANVFTAEAGNLLQEQVSGQLEVFAADITALNERFAEFDARLAAEATARADGDAAIREDLGAQIAELRTAVEAFEGTDTSVIEERLTAAEAELQQWREGELPAAARLAVESMLSDVQSSLSNLDGQLSGMSVRVGNLETAQAYPLRWLYAPIGLSEWYQARPGLGNFTAAGLTLILLAMSIVALRGLFPGREGRLAKAHERLLKGEDGLVKTVDSHDKRLTAVEKRIGSVEEVTDELQQLALSDLDFDEDNDDLANLQPGMENAVLWKVQKKDGSAQYEVRVGVKANTPAGRVFTDIPRKKGGDPVNTPFAITRLKLSILAAINSGRLEPTKLGLNGATAPVASDEAAARIN